MKEALDLLVTRLGSTLDILKGFMTRLDQSTSKSCFFDRHRGFCTRRFCFYADSDIDCDAKKGLEGVLRISTNR
ncbi:hypothetical protein Hanom_Chr09g00813361 [Helianthus anomalus]